MQMNAVIARAVFGVLLSLCFSIGCAYISFDFFVHRGVGFMGGIWAFSSIVATAALILKVITLRRLIKRER